MSNGYFTIVFIVVIFGFMYLVMIRPQQKQRREFQAMVSSLKKGDVILTGAGMYGTIKRIEEDTLVVEIAKGVTIKIPRRAVAEIVSDPQKARAVTTEPATRRGRGRAAQAPVAEIEEESVVDASEVEEEAAEAPVEDIDEDEDESGTGSRRPSRRRK